VLVANGDRVVGRVTWHGTQHGPFAGLPPTHKTIALKIIHIVRFEAETIVEWWGIADLFGAVQQLGRNVVLEYASGLS
jgi:predicted ester cyclase